MDLGYHAKHQIFRKLGHCRPVLDIGTELDLHGRISHTVRIKDTVGINIGIKVILVFSDDTVKLGSSGKHAFVCRRSRNGTGIHKGNGSDLSALQLGALSVREVSGGMADTERIVCGRIACAEAGSAEGCLHYCPCLQKRCRTTVLNKLHINRHGSRIYA